MKERRKVADKTRENILKAATKLFADSGFSGTSTQAIAKAAKVNETLIFHHFGNKEKLWKKVKENILENISIVPLNSEPESLPKFLEEIIQQRISAYQQRPELARLIKWQSLEKKQDKLIAGNKLAPTNWLSIINYLQKKGKIKRDLKPELVVTWLAASINALVFDELPQFTEEKNRQAYIKCLLNGFELALSP